MSAVAVIPITRAYIVATTKDRSLIVVDSERLAVAQPSSRLVEQLSPLEWHTFSPSRGGSSLSFDEWLKLSIGFKPFPMYYLDGGQHLCQQPR